MKEALEACAAGAEIVMLDNFTPERIPAAALQIKEQYPHVLIEELVGVAVTGDDAHLKAFALGHFGQRPEESAGPNC